MRLTWMESCHRGCKFLVTSASPLQLNGFLTVRRKLIYRKKSSRQEPHRNGRVEAASRTGIKEIFLVFHQVHVAGKQVLRNVCGGCLPCTTDEARSHLACLCITSTNMHCLTNVLLVTVTLILR